MSTLLADRYSERIARARDRARSGDAVIGTVGADIPPALVEASGGVPFRLFGIDSADRETATRILGGAVDEAVTGILAAILGGEFDFLRGILVSHDCQASILLFYALRELSRSGEIGLPVHLVDLVHLDRSPSLEFNIVELDRASAVLADWTGTAPTPASLRAALVDHRLLTDELTTLQALRRDPRSGVTGLDALHAFGATSAASAAEGGDLIAAVVADAQPREPEPDELRLFITGSSPIGDELYRVIERRGVLIVSEDHDWGDLVLSVRPDIPSPGASFGSFIESLGTALARANPAAPTSGQHARGQATRMAVAASGARALLSIVRRRDEAAAWDFPQQSEKAGVPSIMLDRQPADLSAEGLASVAAALNTLGVRR